MKYWIGVMLLLLVACRPKPRPLPENSNMVKELSLEEWNKEVLANEVKMIEAYLHQMKIKYERTSTGLYWFNEQEGSGLAPNAGDEVWVKYHVSLLDGTFCYATDSIHPERFVLGRNTKPSGLNEGIGLMTEGSITNFIVPHYLLHGLVGDRESIPPITPAIFKVHLIKVEKR